MKILSLNTSSSKSQILIDEKFQNIKKYVKKRKTVFITDQNVYKLYKKHFEKTPTIVLKPGEATKSIKNVEKILNQLLKWDFDKSGLIVGIGGGVITDITGFVASIYKRGTHFGFVSSTLLGQIDASIGGKNGVNLKSYKNIVGVIQQPEFIICDLNLLQTLPPQEYIFGLSEAIKYTLLFSESWFSFLEKSATKILTQNKKELQALIEFCIRRKISIVSKDEKESGTRKLLNLGHTFGHAIEKCTHLTHGEAVSIGIHIAAQISHQLGFLSQKDVDRIRRLLILYSLPTSIRVKSKSLLEAITQDKKVKNKKIDLILLKRIGQGFIYPMSFNELTKRIHKLEILFK